MIKKTYITSIFIPLLVILISSYSSLFPQLRSETNLRSKKSPSQFWGIKTERKSVLDITRLAKAHKSSIKQHTNEISNSRLDSVILFKDDGSKLMERFIFNSDRFIASKIFYEWINNNWEIQSRELYTYDDNGNNTNILEEIWENDKWGNNYRINSDYDFKGNLTSWFDESWDGLNWIGEYRNQYAYNSSSQMISLLEEFWDGEKWEGHFRTFSEFDISGNNFYIFDEVFNIDHWESSRKVYNLFNSENQLDSTYEEYWEDNKWINQYSSKSEYNTNGNIISDIGYFWDDNSWRTWYRQTFFYDENNRDTLWLHEGRRNNEWVNNEQYKYSYDLNGNKTNEFYEAWEDNKWLKSANLSWQYNLDGKVTQAQYEIFSEDNWIPWNTYLSIDGEPNPDFEFRAAKINAYYSLITDITKDNKLFSNYSLSQNYPNPFNPTTVINYTIPNVASGLPAGQASFSPSNVSLKVYDILGNEVAELVNENKLAGNYSVSFDASTLSSGIYFIRLNAGSFSQVRKMTLLK